MRGKFLITVFLAACGTSSAPPDAPGVDSVSRGAPVRGPSLVDGGELDSPGREGPIFSPPRRDAVATEGDARESDVVEVLPADVGFSPDDSAGADSSGPERSDTGEPGSDGDGDVGDLPADSSPGPEVLAVTEVGREVGTVPEDATPPGPEVSRCRPECYEGCNVGCRDDGQCAACATCSCDVTTGACHC